MAEHYLYTTQQFPDGYTLGWLRRVLTYGQRTAPKMDPCQKIAKKKLGNPMLWSQLDAATKGTFVNHLGRGHARRVEDHSYWRE